MKSKFLKIIWIIKGFTIWDTLYIKGPMTIQ